MSAARAIAWDFRLRHRWGAAALGGYVAVLAAVKLAVATGAVDFGAWTPARLGVTIIVPLTASFVYLLAVFTYGLSGDLAAKQSIYPSRHFTLPVRTSALAAWPMTIGAAAMLVLWIITRALVAWPATLGVPIVWPGVLAAVLLAWTQALTWMPYPLRGARVVVTVVWLAIVDTSVLLALHFNARERTMVALLLWQLPLAYVVARGAVARARAGGGRREAVGGKLTADSGQRMADSDRAPFRSALAAQLWFEWRRHGRSLPTVVALLLPFELALLLAARNAPAVIFSIVIGVLVTPPFMAAFVAAGAREARAHARDAYGLSPFTATRPLSSSALIAAKLGMTAVSTLVTWAVVLAAIPAALFMTDTMPSVVDRWHRATDYMGTPRAVVLVLLIVTACVVWTWRQLVQTLHVGLTGRDWLVKTRVFGTLVMLCAVGPILTWIAQHAAAQVALWDSLAWLPAVLVAVKMGAAAWVFMELYRSGLVGDRLLVAVAAAWCAAVLILYAMLAWFVGTDQVPHHVLVLMAILAVPLARVSAAPLALAWNRHR